jgi:hypothetical protein
MLPEYTKSPAQFIDGLAVSPLPTLLLRTVQQVQLRRDARDFIDLVAIEDAVGPDNVIRWATAWLDRQAGNSPAATVRLYEGLHYGLSRVLTTPDAELASYGRVALEMGNVKDRVVYMARRVAERVPPTSGGPTNGLQRLLSLSDAELAEMRAAAEGLGVTPDEVQLRVSSPAAMAEQRRLAEQDAVSASAEERVRALQPASERTHQHGFPDSGVRPYMG